jgi:chromosome segregation ATPase
MGAKTGKAPAAPQKVLTEAGKPDEAKTLRTEVGAGGGTINKLLFYVTLIGLGIIGGYTAFYSIYNHRCSDLLDEAEGRHNMTREDLETRYKHAMEEHHECLNDESVMLELYELRGRLESLEALEKKHQVLKEAYDDTATELSNLEPKHQKKVDEYEQLQRDFSSKDAQLNNLQGGLDVCAEEKEKLSRTMTDEKRDIDSAMETKIEQLKRLERNYEDCKGRLEEAVLNNERKKQKAAQRSQGREDRNEL